MAKDNKKKKGGIIASLILALGIGGSAAADSTPAASDNTLDNANSDAKVEREATDKTLGLVNDSDVAIVENGTLIQEGVVVDDVNQVVDGNPIPPIPGEGEKDRINTSSEGYGTNQTPKPSGIQNDDEGRAVNGRLEQPGVVDEDVNTPVVEGAFVSQDDLLRQKNEKEKAEKEPGSIDGVVNDYDLPQEGIIFQSGGEQKDSPVKIK